MDGGSSPPASIATRETVRHLNGWRANPKHGLVQHLIPLLGQGHNGDFTLKLGADSTVLGVHEVLHNREWRLSLLVLEDLHSRVEDWHFLVKGVKEKIELPENGAWNCVATIQSRSGYIWAIFQIWPEEGGK